MASLAWHETGRWNLLSSLHSLSSLWICSPAVLCLCCACAHKLYLPVQAMTTWRHGKMNISFRVLRVFCCCKVPEVLLGVSAADETPPVAFSFAQGAHLIIGKLLGLSFLCSERRVFIPLLTVVICVPLHHMCCLWHDSTQVVKEWPRTQIMKSSRSLPFFQHVKPTWTFMLSRAVWYPAVLSSSGDLKEEGFGSLRRRHRTQAGWSLSWVTLLGCLHWCVLHSCSAKALAFAAVLMWEGDHIHTSNCSCTKGIIPLLLSALSSFGCTLSTSRATSLPNSHCFILRRKTFRCQTWFCFSFPFNIIPFPDSHFFMKFVLVSHRYFVLQTGENNCHK